jgi:two-component system, NtrC family, response regulator GlrR
LDGVVVRSPYSLSGMALVGVRVKDACAANVNQLKPGSSALKIGIDAEPQQCTASPQTRFGLLVGRSLALREVFGKLERIAATDATVLLEGETGTGKSAAAESIHIESARKNHPFVAYDCGATPPSLIESELFGHEKGAFTGADRPRVGVFEQASGGTLFLDEIGELPLALQPKLLGVLERREVRRIGGGAARKINVRLITATNRELRTEVNAGRFRADLYYRLAIVRVEVPPLRERLDDLPDIIEAFIAQAGLTDADTALLRAPEFMASLRTTTWPGNVRELRNHLERRVVMRDEAMPEAPAAPGAREHLQIDLSQRFPEARRAIIDEFERRYLHALLEAHDGRVVQAAEAAGVHRVQLYRLLRRHNLR